MYERFTDRARKVMRLANDNAQRLNLEYVDTTHVLLGLLDEGHGVACGVLRNLSVDAIAIRAAVAATGQSEPAVSLGKLPQTPKVKQVIENAIGEAKALGHNYVGTEHLLLGLVSVPDSVACNLLLAQGVTPEKVREEVTLLLGPRKPNPGPMPSPEQVGLWVMSGFMVAAEGLVERVTMAERNRCLSILQRFREDRQGQELSPGHVIECLVKLIEGKQ